MHALFVRSLSRLALKNKLRVVLTPLLLVVLLFSSFSVRNTVTLSRDAALLVNSELPRQQALLEIKAAAEVIGIHAAEISSSSNSGGKTAPQEGAAIAASKDALLAGLDRMNT